VDQVRGIVLLITTDSRDQADIIARSLLDARKVACVNIVPQVDSLFWWEGKVDSARECLLIAKTKPSVLDEVITLVKRIHSYDVPEIIALPILGGNEDYLKWVKEEVEG
jgi:periplasmic divalent cation tolerance protein